MASRRDLARAIADAFLAGEWSATGMLARAEACLGEPVPWLRPAVTRARRAFSLPPLDRRDELAALLWDAATFGRPFGVAHRRPAIRHRFFYQPAMGPPRWDVPSLATLGDLQRWLGVDGPHFDWFVDRKGLERFASSERLRHYRYRWVPKRRGGWRLIEQPKADLKAMQRRVLQGILARIPTHEAAHGFRAQRSVLTFAAPHVARRLVLRLDLTDFFVTIPSARVFGIFRTAGYPEEVARALTALCANRTSRAVTQAVEIESVARRRLQTPHLPQGAPTSPALANLAAFGLDARLTAFAASTGGRYTRYADDLAFSFDASVGVERFLAHASAIAMEEGFLVNFRKQRVLSQARRQQLAGVVVNEHPNVPRRDFDQLKAILHNCARFGPATQSREASPNFQAQLLGRVAWVTQVNPQRGARLQAMYEVIDWARQSDEPGASTV